MRWGRPLKTHLPGGGATLQDFCAVYGLNLLFRFWDAFCLPDEEEKTTIRPRHTHTYAFRLYWCICQPVCALSCIMYARMRTLG